MREVRHPHLLGQFGAWQREGYLIIAMELGERTLLNRLQEAVAQGLPGLPLEELLEAMREAAKGLDHLHKLGLQHRDVKPANFLLVGEGVKVADFGLAKLLEHTVTTVSGGGMTPAYAPPEFFRNQVSRWSDQYSLAVTYCQLRGNRLPIKGGHLASLMAGHLSQPPDLSMLPAAERRAVARALAKKPEDRWPTCREFIEALAADVRAAVPAEPRKASRPPGRGELLTNSVGLQLVRLPAGKFLMGSPPDEEGRSANEVQHEVELRHSYYMGVYAVTQEEYRAVMGQNPSWFSAHAWGKDAVKGVDTSRFPVENLSWQEAVDFCRTLSERPEEKILSRLYRLPTEAEWEYACRGGAREITPFHFGRALSSKQANFDGKYPYGGADPGPFLERPTSVGSYSPNAFGLYDMHGNVAEWCADWYGKYPEGPCRDPKGPANGSQRVLRGGAWFLHGRYCRSAVRMKYPPQECYYSVGFRVVLVTGRGM
jgi:formylglycine-generating enzyme required for sulfatase activity